MVKETFFVGKTVSVSFSTALRFMFHRLIQFCGKTAFISLYIIITISVHQTLTCESWRQVLSMANSMSVVCLLPHPVMPLLYKDSRTAETSFENGLFRCVLVAIAFVVLITAG